MSTQFGGSVQVVPVGSVDTDPSRSSTKTPSGGSRVGTRQGTRSKKREVIDETKQAAMEGVGIQVQPKYCFGMTAGPLDGLVTYR